MALGLNKNIYATLFPFIQPDEKPKNYSNPNRPDQINAPYDQEPTPQTPMVDQTNYGYGREIEQDPTANTGELTQNQTVTPPTNQGWKPAEMDLKLNPYDEAYKGYVEATQAAKPKIPAWQNALFLALQGASKIFNPNDQSEIETLGQLKQRKNIEDKYRKFAPLQALHDKDLAERYRLAQLNEIQRRPEKEKEVFQQKVEIESQKALNKLKYALELRKAKGEDASWATAKDGSGRIVVKDGNGKENFLLDENGEYQYNPLEKPQAHEIQDGVDDNGNPKYKTVYVKGSQLLSNDTAEKWRQASINLDVTKFNANNKEKDDEDEVKYKEAVNKHEEEKNGLTADVLAKNDEINSLFDENQRIETQIAGMSPLRDKAEIAKLKKEQRDNITKQDNIRAEMRKSSEKLKGLKPPVRPTKRQKVSAPGSGRYSGKFFKNPASLKSAFPGKSEQEIRQIVEANGGGFNQ